MPTLEKGKKKKKNTEFDQLEKAKGQYDLCIRTAWETTKDESRSVGTTTLYWIWDFILKTTGVC